MVEFLDARDSALLAADKGTGKTRAVLQSIWNCFDEQPYEPFEVLIVAPKLASQVWQDELYAMVANLHWDVACWNFTAMKGTVKDKSVAYNDIRNGYKREREQALQIYIMHYDMVRNNDMAKVLSSPYNPLDIIVCDESHRIKSYNSKISKVMAGIAKKQVKHLHKKICMTATPVPNGRQDIFGQMRFLDDSVFGKSYTKFRGNYFFLWPVPGTIGVYKITGDKNGEEYEARLAPFIMHLSIEEVSIDMPTYNHSNIPLSLPPKLQTQYKRMEKESVAEFKDATVLAGNALARMLRLHQMTGMGKGPALRDILQDFGDEPVVIFYQYNFDREIILNTGNALGLRTGAICGGRSDLDEWKAGDIDLLAVQYQAGAESIDLTRARFCIFYSLTWNAALYDQALGRIYRVTQKRPVVWYYLIANKTVDEDIAKALKNKLSVSDTLLAKYK